MEAMELRQEPDAPGVLGYQAVQQRRWERGIVWLAGIVCVTQFASLPGVLAEVFMSLHQDRFEALTGARAAAALAMAICALLMLLRRVHKPLIICTVATLLLWIARGFWAEDEWRHYSDPGRPHYLLKSIANVALWCYPLVLLSVVSNRANSRRRLSGAAAIWWMTAIAAMAVALPTVFQWITQFENTWSEKTLAVFAAFIGKRWWLTLYGIGMVTGAMACFSAFGAVAWTLFRGASGRWALMICAALWIVFAAGFFGTSMAESLYYIVARGPGAGILIAYSALSVGLPLTELAGWLAFPLAIRVALTLSDVRAKLEGKALPSQ